jgi:hypothetical protein
MCSNQNSRRPVYVLSLQSNGTYFDFPFQNFGCTGEVSSSGLALRNMGTSQLSLIISYLLLSLVYGFCVQSNKPQCRVLLTSNLTANYDSTTQNKSSLHFYPSLFWATPPKPFPIVFGLTTTGFYFTLSEEFKIL